MAHVVWIVIALVAALAGAVALAVYAVGLRHRVENLRVETEVTSARLKEIADLIKTTDVAPLRRD